MNTPTWIDYAILIPLGILAIVWGVSDLVIIAKYGLGSGYTISWTIYSASKDYPAIPFLVGLVIGLLCGHLFLGMAGE